MVLGDKVVQAKDVLAKTSVEAVVVSNGSLEACAAGEREEGPDGNQQAGLVGGKHKVVVDLETPSFVVGPLVEKAINEL